MGHVKGLVFVGRTEDVFEKCQSREWGDRSAFG